MTVVEVLSVRRLPVELRIHCLDCLLHLSVFMLFHPSCSMS